MKKGKECGTIYKGNSIGSSKRSQPQKKKTIRGVPMMLGLEGLLRGPREMEQQISKKKLPHLDLKIQFLLRGTKCWAQAHMKIKAHLLHPDKKPNPR